VCLFPARPGLAQLVGATQPRHSVQAQNTRWPTKKEAEKRSEPRVHGRCASECTFLVVVLVSAVMVTVMVFVPGIDKDVTVTVIVMPACFNSATTSFVIDVAS